MPREHQPSTLPAATEFDTTHDSAEDSSESLAAGLPPLEIDRLALQREQQLILARMFGTELEPNQLGHYTLLDELGRGGMGVVYAAHDRRLDRKVAIKSMTGRRGPEFRRRFEREAQAMAKLAHPNVVQVYEIGETDDSTFIAMEYVEGVTLRQWLADGPHSRTAILDTFMAAGHGLAAAHEVGLVHRDFKPDNVMVRADGRVLVMDFGLVGRDRSTSDWPDSDASDPATELTRTGAVMGTPVYMAPEQWTDAKVTAQADQFGFCVALWEALHGERPFDDSNRATLERAVTTGARRPAKRASVPQWLQQVLERGLELEPSRRFGSMRALLDAVESDPSGRLLRWGIAMAVVLLLVMLTAGLIGRSTESNKARASKVQLREIEDEARLTSPRMKTGGAERMIDAIRLADRFGPEAALEFGPEFASPPAMVTDVLLDGLAVDVRWGARFELREPQSSILASAWSPDGTLVATGAANHTARVWDATTGGSRHELLGHEDQVHTVKFSPDGGLLATASDDHSVRIWNVHSGAVEHRIGDCSGALAFGPTAELVTANSDGSATVWDPASGRVLTELDGHEGETRAVAVSPDGTRVATAGSDQVARIWDTASGVLLREFEGHLGALDFVQFSSDGEFLATRSEDKRARVWDVASGAGLHEFAEVNVITFSPLGPQVLIANQMIVSSWDIETGERREWHSGGHVITAQFSSDAERILTGSWSVASTWNIADVDSYSLTHDNGRTNGYEMRSADFSPVGERIMTTLDTTRLWEPNRSRRVDERVLPMQNRQGHRPHTAYPSLAAFSRDGTRLVVIRDNHYFESWDVSTGERMADREYEHSIVAVAPTQGEGLVVMTNSGGLRGVGPNPPATPDIVRVWDAQSNDLIHDLTGRADLAADLAISSTQEWVVVADGFSAVAKVIHATSGEVLHELVGDGLVQNIAVSSDDKRILANTHIGAPSIWAADSGDALFQLEGATSMTRAPAFSPDGKLAVTISQLGAVNVWDAATGHFLGQRDVRGDAPIAVGFSANGNDLFTVTSDGTLRRQPTNPRLAACHVIEATTQHRAVAFPCARAEMFERRGFVHTPDLEAVREDRRIDIGLWLVLAAFHVLVPAILLVTGVAASLRNWAAKSPLRPPLVVAAFLGPCMMLSTIAHDYDFVRTTLALVASEVLVQTILATLASMALLGLVRRQPDRWWLWLGLALISTTSAATTLAPLPLSKALDDDGSILPPTLEILLHPLTDLAGAETSRGFPAHLDAHANAHHAALALVGFSAATLLALFLVHRIWRYSSRRFGHRFGFERTNLVTLPLLLASFNLVGLAMLPLATFGFRQLEREADRAALDQTHDNRGCATAAVVEGRGHVEPHALPFIDWDPKQAPIEDRIDRCNHYRPWEPNPPHFYDVAVEVARKW